MIELMPDMPDNVVAIKAVGKISKQDYETVLIPAVEEKLATGGKVRLLYYLGHDYTEFEAGAMWTDAKVDFEHLTSWEKIAVVTDVEWIKAMVGVFGFVMHGKVKLFPAADLDPALEWIKA